MDDGIISDQLPRWRSRVGQDTTVNDRYAAFISQGEVYIQNLKGSDREAHPLRLSITFGRTQPVIALSSTQPNYLIIASGSRIHSIDVVTQDVKHSFPGIGRTVTCIALSVWDSNVIATGHIDGTVCVWDLRRPTRLSQRIASTGYGPCLALEFSPTRGTLLTAICDGKLDVWDLSRSTIRLIHPIYSKTIVIEAVAWHPLNPGWLATATNDCKILIYDLGEVIGASSSPKSFTSNEEDSDDGIFGEPDGVQRQSQPLWEINLATPAKSISWIGAFSLLALAVDGEIATAYMLHSERQKVSGEPDSLKEGLNVQEIVSWIFESEIDSVHMARQSAELKLLVIGQNGVEYQSCQGLLDGLGDVGSGYLNSIARTALQDNGSESSESAPALPHSASPSMRPLSIASRRERESSFSKTAKQLQQRRLRSQAGSSAHLSTAKSLGRSKSDSPSTPPRSMVSSLELPKNRDAGDMDSPMPFLSPTIPSRKASMHENSPMNESTITLQPLPASSFDTSIPSTAAAPSVGRDSDDSDDETFVDDMQGSTIFLPGGINVPLPKACGALFAPNGQLLTFFPPKPKPAFFDPDVVVEIRRQRRSKGNKLAKLFPTFGNLPGDFGSNSEESNSDDISEFEEPGDPDGLQPTIAVQPASFPSQESWRSRVSFLRPIVDTSQSQHKVIVNVHQLDDVDALHPTQRQLAEQYRIICDGGESGSDLCESNALVAREAGLHEVADIWRLLSMLLEDRVPLDLLSVGSAENDILLIAQRARPLVRNDSSDSFVRSTQRHGKLRWAGHAFGSSWIVRQILTWAECRADIQLLACICAVLSEADEHSTDKGQLVRQSMLANLPTHSQDYIADGTKHVMKQAVTKVIPILRTRTATASSLYESPTKLLRDSNASSRMPSQSTTPFLDSHNTPPWTSPHLSRQTTGISISGSASPELNRGSFGAAAKYYAQSHVQAITDRFSTYGTSPPIRKLGTSPSANNELSTSLPAGSWLSKSVSFASTTTEDTTQTSMLSSRRETSVEDDAYDSDKTIEDSSAPHTPNSAADVVVVPTFRNQDMFSDDVSGFTKARFLPEDLAQKAKICCQYYAELLRSWNMLDKAAELEKIVGLTVGTPAVLDFANFSNSGISPTMNSRHARKACVICLTNVEGVEQTCPSCSHSSHFNCLEGYIADLDNGEYTCPTGCGCLCSELPYVVPEFWQQPPQARPAFKKHPSFTDPRRWRAKVEGEGWE